jgi:hypothetical protein
MIKAILPNVELAHLMDHSGLEVQSKIRTRQHQSFALVCFHGSVIFLLDEALVAIRIQ